MLIETKTMNASYKELKRLTKNLRHSDLEVGENISYDDYFRNLTPS